MDITPDWGADDDQPHSPIHDALTVGDERDLEDLRDIIARVRWVKSSTVPFARHQVVKTVAVFDMFTEWSDDRKADELRRRFPDDRALDVRGPAARIRKTKAYTDITTRLAAARDRIRTPATLEKQVEEGAVDAFESLHRTVIRGRGKEQYMAAREFTDRALPRQGVDLGGRSVVIGLAIGQQLFSALETLQNKGRVLDVAPKLKQLPD